MKLHFGYLLGFSALAIAGCAAFFSVYGIGQLFQGAFWAVVAMASALELGKLVAASFLQRYWKAANRLLKIYLVIGVTFLMVITSGGIYGFLSSAYQETFQQLAVNENEIEFLETKKKFFEDDVARYDKELTQINDNITKLSEQGVNSIQVRDENSETGFRNTISTAGLRAAQERIAVEEENKSKVRERRNIAADSLQKYQLQILNKENDVEASGELGPLKYVANLTGVPMDKVVNWFILLFIFVFDPLAVTLVIATNWVFEKEGLKRKKKNDEPNEGVSEGVSEGVKPEKVKKKSLFGKIFAKKPKVEGVSDAVNDAVNEGVNDAVNATVNDTVSATVSATVKEDETPKFVSAKDEKGEFAPTPAPTIAPTGVVVKKSQPTTGIKPEDIANVRKNAKNITRKIPVRRGY